jgi:hypothetical protein
MMRHVFSVALLLAVGTAPAQTSGPAATHGNGKAVAIYAPRPDSPIEARERHLTGSGVAILQVDPKTGYVTAAQSKRVWDTPCLTTLH